jgi:hypothetical protein
MMSPASQKVEFAFDWLQLLFEQWTETFRIWNCLMALGPGSFHSCRLHEKVTFEQGCHLKEIPELCFACCGFEFIVIQNSIETLGNWASFRRMSNE